MNGESNGNVKSLSFLNYLHGSELFLPPCKPLCEFLNYLHGSEQQATDGTALLIFLNYLHGSELEHNIL